MHFLSLRLRFRARYFRVKIFLAFCASTLLASCGGNWLIDGMTNGSGTHSADGDPALITADGFVRELAISAP